jgi:pyruvate ferredoxin oxidoreductase alpha subunit
MGALAGASAAGARAFTGSCGQGLAFMTENVYITAGRRLPVVMGVPSRSIASPGGSHTAHDDSMIQRDSGWIQLYCENNQEVLDTIVQAYKISEDKRVYLPTMVMWEGHGLAHTTMAVEIPDQEEVDKFLPPYKHEWYSLEPLHGKNPPDYGRSSGPNSAQRGRYIMGQTLENAKTVIKEVNEEWGKRFGRRYGNGLIEEYQCKGAEAVLIMVGCDSGTAKDVIDKMREDGESIGLIRIRAFRPFPTEDIKEAARNVVAIGVLDRNNPYGAVGGGIVFHETASALYSLDNKPLLMGFHTGIARYTTADQMRYIAGRVLKASETGEIEKEVEWVWMKGEVES